MQTLILVLWTINLKSGLYVELRNRRRSEINLSELQAVASQHSQEGEEQGEELGSGDHGQIKDEDQRSLLGSCEDINEVESDHCSERDRDGDSDDGNRRTVLHTYSVFISNIGADEKHRVSNSTNHHSDHSNHVDRSCSSEEQDHCCINVEENTTELEGSGETSSNVDQRGNSSSAVVEVKEGGSGKREVKLARKEKVKSGIKAALVDLKLFLW